MATSSAKADVSSPVFFWREYGDKYGFLSQWYHSPFHTDDDSTVIYRTAEQYMMHQKALLFADHEVAAEILKTTAPKEQKSLGRQVRGFTQEVWEANRERIVEEGSYFKFKYGKDEGEGKEDGIGLRAKLLATGEREIVEASPSKDHMSSFPIPRSHSHWSGGACFMLPTPFPQKNYVANSLKWIEFGELVSVQRMLLKGGWIGA
jgi:ribA/ribD-fused uncharacterized protein